jgi:predicted transcriptional regulator
VKCLSRLPNFGASKGLPKHRSGLEIAVDVLSVVSKRTRKTRIMYQANLSFRLIEKYLAILLEQELLKCETGSCYLITHKGKKFLQMYTEYVERCKKIGEDMDEAHRKRQALEDMCFNEKLDPRRQTLGK